MKNILILGSNGMLGKHIDIILSQNKNLNVFRSSRMATPIGNDVPLNVENFLSFPVKWIKFFEDYRFDYVVNAIGSIKPRIIDSNPESVQSAIRVNSLFPHALSESVKKANVGTKILQIATDCVYSGQKGNYNEDDICDPIDCYGYTKILGEKADIINLRCSIIGSEFNGRRQSLVEWFRNLPKESKVKGLSTALWNGVSCLAFAKVIDGIVQNDVKLGRIQHLIPKDKVSKLEMLRYFAEFYNRQDVQIEPVHPISIDRTLSTQNTNTNELLWNLAGYHHIPTVKDMIKEMAEFEKNNSYLFPRL